MGNDFSSYINDVGKLPDDICVIYATPGLFYGINLPEAIVNGIRQVYIDVWKKELTKIKYYNPTLVKFVPHKHIMYQGAGAGDSVKSKKMFCQFHKLFCTHGWSLSNSPTLTYAYSLSSWFYQRQMNPYMVEMGALDNDFCAISLSGYDSFQFVYFPEKLETRVIECLKVSYPKGVKEKKPIDDISDVWSIEMNGNPWSSYGEESIEARFLVLTLIRFMSHANWRLVNSTAMKPDASDTLFFRNYSKAFNEEVPEEMPEYYFMLALMGDNYFSVLGVSENIKDAIANSCARHEEKGIKPVDIKKGYPAIVMNSNVWSRRYEKELKTKLLMTLLFQDLASIGWLPVESVDCTRSIRDLSSITFVSIPPVRIMFFCLSPKKYNGISLVNAPEDARASIVESFKKHYPIKKEKIIVSSYGIGVSIDFHGDAYDGYNKFGILFFQETLAAAISDLKGIGWNLALSADTSNETKTVSSGNSSKKIKHSIYSLWFAKFLPS